MGIANTATPGRLLVIDDDENAAALVVDVAEGIGSVVKSVHNWEDFREAYGSFEPTVIVLDLVMPDVDGVEILRFLADQQCRAKILLISGSDTRTIDSIKRLGQSLNLDTAGTIQKPIGVLRLEALLRKALGLGHPIDEAELSKAIQGGEIVPYFQPKIQLPAGTICGLEALARWKHPDHGVITPDAFIPLAERGQLIFDLTLSIVEGVLEELRQWTREGLEVPVSVNLSVRCLADLTLPDLLIRCLGTDIDSSLLVFEVTENLDIGEDSDPTEVLTRLRLKGFGLSMDDFGTGYSTLVQLARLPFTELKIDREFVAEIGEHRESEIVIESSVAMAHSMGMTVCAEGVETGQALEFVRGAGCDSTQGFLISRPISSDKVIPFLRSWDPARLSLM